MHISFFPEIIFDGVLPISNAMIMSWIAIAALLIISFFLTKRLNEVPGKTQNLAECTIEGIISFMTTVTGNKEKTHKFFPLVATIFIFVLICNWMGILPGVGSIVVEQASRGQHDITPVFRPVNSDLNMPIALALISMIAVQIFGIAATGFFRYFSKFISFKSPLAFFTGLLELITEVAKIISFSFRLFGNIFAGEVLLGVMFFLIPLIVPIPFLAMELFVGFIQALIFAMLTLVFLNVATAEQSH